MVYTEPTTRTTGDLITASIWNTDLVDDISFLNANLGILDAKLAFSRLGGAASFSFTSLSTAYDDLFIKMVLRSSTAAQSDSWILRFNNDSGGNYERQQISATSTTVAASTGTADTSLGDDSLDADSIAAAQSFSLVWVWVLEYSSSTIYKPVLILSGGMVGSTSNRVRIHAAQYKSATAISRVDITASAGTTFVANSTVAIYGGQSI